MDPAQPRNRRERRLAEFGPTRASMETPIPPENQMPMDSDPKKANPARSLLARTSEKVDQFNGWIVGFVSPWIEATLPAVLALEALAIFGLGATLMQISESFFAICVFIVLGFLLLAKSFTLDHWVKMTLGSVGAIFLTALLITIAVLHKPDSEQWSNLQKPFRSKAPTASMANTNPSPSRQQQPPPTSNDVGHLSEWQKTTLIGYLSKYRGQKILLLDTDGQESKSLAQDLKLFLSSNDIGWKVEGPIPAPLDQRVMDLHVSGAEDTFGKNDDPPSMRVLRDGLNFVGIQTANDVLADPQLYSGEIALWVAPASPGRIGEIVPPPEIECRNPMRFSDIPTAVPPVKGHPEAIYGREIVIKTPLSDFHKGDTFRVFLTEPMVTFWPISPENSTVVPVGKRMVTNQILDVTVQRDRTPDLMFLMASDRKDMKVKCIGFPR